MVRPVEFPFAIVLTAVLAHAAHAQVVLDPGLPSASAPKDPVLYAAVTDGSTGGLLEVRGGPPWSVELLAETSGGEWLRVFGKHVFVLDVFGSTITMVQRDGRSTPVVIDLGANSQPQDVHVVGNEAFVTRRNDPVLLRVDLATGAATPVADLSVLADPQEEVTLRTMERHRNRLFVQVGFVVRGDALQAGDSRGVLAVLDVSTKQLIDADPSQPGVQGIALAGAPPRGRMQVLADKLYVSTTDSHLDNRGGIEIVDLVTLQSVGYALTEEHFGADLGGFVMTSTKGGYFVFHTDIVASTHLEPFTVAGGVDPGPEMIVLLGEALDSLAYDPLAGRIYLPTGFAFFPPTGIYAFDTRTNEPVEGPIVTGMKPRDILLAY